MSRRLSDSDQRVLAKIRTRESGASAVDIARAHLGERARKHSIASLNLIGLSIAARLCGQQVITPTRSNYFKITPRR
jgi:hypothetical protein